MNRNNNYNLNEENVENQQYNIEGIIETRAYIDNIIQNPELLTKDNQTLNKVIENLRQKGETQLAEEICKLREINQQYIETTTNNIREQMRQYNNTQTTNYQQQQQQQQLQIGGRTTTTTTNNFSPRSINTPIGIPTIDQNTILNTEQYLTPHTTNIPTTTTTTTVEGRTLLNFLNNNRTPIIPQNNNQQEQIIIRQTLTQEIPYTINNTEEIPYRANNREEIGYTINKNREEIPYDKIKKNRKEERIKKKKKIKREKKEKTTNDNFEEMLMRDDDVIMDFLNETNIKKERGGGGGGKEKEMEEKRKLKQTLAEQRGYNIKEEEEEREFEKRQEDIANLSARLDEQKKKLTTNQYKKHIETYSHKYNKELCEALQPYTNVKAVDPQKNPIVYEEYKDYLTDFQSMGVSWLIKMQIQEKPMILADDAGLGKLYQLFAFLLLVKEQNRERLPSLLVVKDEERLKKVEQALTKVEDTWTNSLNYVVIAMDDDLNAVSNLEEHLQHNNRDLVVTVPQKLIASNRIGTLKKIKWQMIILDWCEAVTKEKCKLVKLLRTYLSYNRLFLTPHKVQTDTKLIWAVIHFIYPRIFEGLTRRHFESWYGSPFAPNVKFKLRGTNPNREKRLLNQILLKIIEPLTLRRTKEDVRFHLPKEEFHVVTTPITQLQIYCYWQYLQELAMLGDHRQMDVQKSQVVDILKKLTRVCVNPMNNFEIKNVYKVFRTKEMYLRQLPAISSKFAWLNMVLPFIGQFKKRIAILSTYKGVLVDLHAYLKMKNLGMPFYLFGELEDCLPTNESSISLLNTQSLDFHNYSFDIIFALDVDALHFSRQFTTCGGKSKSKIIVISLQSATPFEFICYDAIKDCKKSMDVLDKKWKHLREVLLQDCSSIAFGVRHLNKIYHNFELFNRTVSQLRCLNVSAISNMFAQHAQEKAHFESLLHFPEPSTVFYMNAQRFHETTRTLLFDLLKIDMNKPLPSSLNPKEFRFVRQRDNDDNDNESMIFSSGPSRRLKRHHSTTDLMIDDDNDNHVYPFKYSGDQLNDNQREIYQLFKNLVNFRDPETNNFVSAPFWHRHDGISLHHIEERIGTVTDYSFNILLHDFEELYRHTTSAGLKNCAHQLVHKLRSFAPSQHESPNSLYSSDSSSLSNATFLLDHLISPFP